MSGRFFYSSVSFLIFYFKNPKTQQQQNNMLLQSLLLTRALPTAERVCFVSLQSCWQCSANTLFSLSKIHPIDAKYTYVKASYLVLLVHQSYWRCLCCWLQCTRKYKVPCCWLHAGKYRSPCCWLKCTVSTRCPAVDPSVSTSRPDCNVRIGFTVVDCTLNTYLPVVDWSVPLHRK
jgi:hypothetical protein